MKLKPSVKSRDWIKSKTPSPLSGNQRISEPYYLPAPESYRKTYSHPHNFRYKRCNIKGHNNKE